MHHPTHGTSSGVLLLPNTAINNNILNLSGQVLTETETETLKLGLSFVPSISRVSAQSIHASLDRLTRSLMLRDFFKDRDGPIDSTKRLFTYPSTWTPSEYLLSKDTVKLIKTLRENTERTVRQYELKNNFYYLKNVKSNISGQGRKAITNLRNNDKIIIKPADKGGMICIMNKLDYNREAYRQLTNNKYYKPITQLRKTEVLGELNSVIDQLLAKKYIHTKQHAYLSADMDDRNRQFYLLPKVHKPRDRWPTGAVPEGRPIVSDCATESRRASEYIDHFLKPLACKHPSYLKDTYDFLDKIRNQIIDKKFLLVTGDVTALYTNMNIDRTIKVVEETFNSNPDPKRTDCEITEINNEK